MAERENVCWVTGYMPSKVFNNDKVAKKLKQGIVKAVDTALLKGCTNFLVEFDNDFSMLCGYTLMLKKKAGQDINIILVKNKRRFFKSQGLRLAKKHEKLIKYASDIVELPYKKSTGYYVNKDTYFVKRAAYMIVLRPNNYSTFNFIHQRVRKNVNSAFKNYLAIIDVL